MNRIFHGKELQKVVDIHILVLGGSFYFKFFYFDERIPNHQQLDEHAQSISSYREGRKRKRLSSACPDNYGAGH